MTGYVTYYRDRRRKWWRILAYCGGGSQGIFDAEDARLQAIARRQGLPEYEQRTVWIDGRAPECVRSLSGLGDQSGL